MRLKLFYKATNQEKPPKSNNLTDKTTHQENSSSSRFSIILLGGLANLESQCDNLSSINTFLKSASIEAGNDLYHLIQRDDNTSFELIILKNANRLLHSVLFSKAHLILILPDNVADFNCCAKIVKDYAHVLPVQTKIYYNFPKDSPEHSLITKKARFFGYESVHENGINCLLELTKERIPEKGRTFPQ